MSFELAAAIVIVVMAALTFAIRTFCDALLPVSRAIDAINLRIGKAVTWLVLIMVLVSAGNAIVRKTLNTSSNAWLEVQWYMFAAVVLLGTSYTLLRNEHIRIDVVSNRFSRRGLAKVDVFGIVVFLLPVSLIIMWLAWPLFANSITKAPAGETSPGFGSVIAGFFNPRGWEASDQAGGLIRWPAKILIPLGFFLLSLQGFSELVKRFAFLRGLISDPNEKSAAA